MKTKLLAVVSLLAAGMLVACSGGPKESAGSSKAPVSSVKTSSTSKAGASSTSKEGASSTSKATSSSKAQSSEAPKEWVAGNKDGVVTPETKGTEQAYRLDVADAEGWNKPTTKMNGKNGTNDLSTWSIEGKLPAGKYAVEIEALMTYESHGNRYFFNHALNGKDDDAQTPDSTSESPFRYFFLLDKDEANPINPTTDKTWAELGFEGQDKGGSPKFVEIVNEFTIPAGTSTFSLKHGNIGFSMIISRVRLVLKEKSTNNNFKTWGYDEMKAAMSAGSGEKTGGDAKLYKMGSGETCALKYTAAAAGKAKFMMLAATKTGNVSHGFRYDDSGKLKYEIQVNSKAAELPAAAEDVTMDAVGFSTEDCGIADSGNVGVAVWVEYCTIDLVAGENTIVVAKKDGGYSFYFGGFGLAK